MPFAVDPGEQVIVATAPGYARWSTTMSIGAQGDTKTVVIPALDPVEEAPASGSGVRVGGGVVTAVGGAAVIAGGILGGIVLADAGAAREDPALCPDEKCTLAGREHIGAAESKATAATIALAAGGALAVTGILMLVLAPASDAGSEATAFVLPLAPAGNPGLTIIGVF